MGLGPEGPSGSQSLRTTHAGEPFAEGPKPCPRPAAARVSLAEISAVLRAHIRFLTSTETGKQGPTDPMDRHGGAVDAEPPVHR